jgi:uncharacterized membrane protein HdeD (DUF308 family)
VLPLLGFAILAAVIINANIAAQVLGVVWLVAGIIVAVVLQKTGRMGDPSAAVSSLELKEVR